MMVYSEDSSDREEKLFSPKTRVSSLKQKSVSNLNSYEVSTTHGIVVDNRTRSRKSPTKQSRKTNHSESLKSPTKEQNCVAESSSSHNSEDERPTRPHVRNIKVEKFSSGSESEDAVCGSRNTVQTKKYAFDDDDDEDEKGKVLKDTNVRKESAKKPRFIVKQEVISSEDEETIIRKDPDDDIISLQKKLPKFKHAKKEAGSGSDSETEIPPSQYWLHYYRNNEKTKDKKPALKKSSKVQNSDSEESGDEEKRALVKVELSPKKKSQRKSPPKITKMEIISTKYKRINQQIPEAQKEASNDVENSDDGSKVLMKEEPNISERSSDDNERDEKVLQEKENSEDSSDDKLDTTKKTSPQKVTPSSKKQSPKKTAALPNRRLSSKVEAPESKFSIKANTKKTNKVTPSKRKLNDSSSKKPLQIRENIWDNGTSSEEEEDRIKRQETALKFVLALQKPIKSSTNSNGRLTISVAKANDKFVENSKPKVVSEKRQSPSPQVPIPPANNANDNSSSEENSSNEAPKRKIERKESPKKKQQANSSSGEEESLVTEAAASQEQETIRHRLSTTSATAFLKRTLDSTITPAKKKPASSSSEDEEEREAAPVKRAASQDQKIIGHSSSSGSASASLKKKLDSKVSPTKKKPASSSSDEEEEEREVATSQEQETIKHRSATVSASASLKKELDSKITLAKKKSASSSSDEEEEREGASVKRAASQGQETIGHSSSSGSASASLKGKLDSKVSPTKKKPASSSSDDEEEEREAAASQEQETIKHRSVTGSASSSLKRKLDSDETLNTEKTPVACNAKKVPLKRKKSESNSPELESSKRSKVMPPSKAPLHTMSDSDETDSLTKLNTTLNKSMALMENRSEKEELTKKASREGRKSVSINTTHKTKHVPNDTMTQKSILKKPELPNSDDNTESDSLSQEQTVQERVEPVVMSSKMIKRPLNLRDLKKQENLAYDSSKASFRLDDLSDDDEIYILDVPRTVDPKELKGQTIRLGGKNKLKIGDRLYETCANDAANISCVFKTGKDGSSYKAVNIEPAGRISVRQKLSKPSQIELTPVEKRSVPFPENLKVRHPLFGAVFEDKIINANIKVSKKTSGSVKKSDSILRSETAKPEKRSTKLNNVERKEKEIMEPPEKLIKSKIKSKPKAKVGKMQQVSATETVSGESDSDSNGSFFQQVKHENIEQTEDRKNLKYLSSILNLDETSVNPDLPTELEETVILKRPKLSAKKKLGLSMDESVIKHKSFDVISKNSKFFSSTPIKVEKDEKGYEDEIPIKVRKRKNRSVS